MSAPSVAIVILNWNGKHHLQTFLPSVLSTAYSSLRVIVADNASTDDSVIFLQTAYPQVEVIQLDQNFGFAKGYNEALKQVQSDYYVLLNSDVEVEANWLQPIIDVMANDERAGACQPKILAYTNRHLFEYAGAGGGWLDAFGYPFARGRVFDICETDEGQYNSTKKVFWATGAAIVVRSDVFHQLRGLDEYFFAHQEEIDLCWRMQAAGYDVYCCPQSVVYHVGGGTLPRGNSRKTYLNFRNNQIMLAKNLPWSEKWWKIPFRLALDQVSALKGLLAGDGGYFKAIFRAHMAFAYWIVFGNRTWVPAKTKQLKSLSGVYTGNIAWQHFVLKKTRFNQLVDNHKKSEL